MMETEKGNRRLMMFADYHVHTAFSDDSVYPMEEVVKDAIGLHLDEICFTDHVDYGIKEDWDSGKEIQYRDGNPITNVDYPSFMKEIERVREKYNGKISIKTGMEFGIQTHTIPRFQELFARYPFDFILLSIHQVEDTEFWTYDFQRGRSQKEYNERYYEELLNVVQKYKNYSVIGHMDYIKRYDEEGIYPFEKVKPIIAEILKIVIADGKGIEINTSSHRYGMKDSMPSTELLTLYRDLGGEIVTIGSDSHSPGQLGSYIPEATEQLKALGFSYLCTYEKMQPVFHRL